MKFLPSKCPTCGGNKEPGKTTFTVDLGKGVVVIREVPASICSQCGDEWFSDDVSAKLESIVEDARKRNLFVEIANFDAA